MSDRHKMIIAKRIALELRKGMVVNLGVGIPTFIQDFLESGHGVSLHSENGILGMGKTPDHTAIDMDLISASKSPVTLESGASIFSSADAFAMIRGGHIDLAVMGALQVSERGEIANWAIPDQDILGVGGAMDLVNHAKVLIIALKHVARDGTPKLVEHLTYPSSGIRCAQMAVTEKGVFTFENGRMFLQEIAEGCTIEDIRGSTRAHFQVKENLKTMAVSQRLVDENSLQVVSKGE